MILETFEGKMCNMWAGQGGINIEGSEKIRTHLEDQEERMKFGETLEVEYTNWAFALCLRFRKRVKPLPTPVGGRWQINCSPWFVEATRQCLSSPTLELLSPGCGNLSQSYLIGGTCVFYHYVPLVSSSVNGDEEDTSTYTHWIIMRIKRFIICKPLTVPDT